MKDSHFIFGREYPRQYDAIVIGAGIGGLFCANMLARGGMKVLLLERHYMLGGFCSTFRPAAWSEVTTWEELLNMSMSYIATLTDRSTVPDSCHCHSVCGGGTQHVGEHREGQPPALRRAEDTRKTQLRFGQAFDGDEDGFHRLSQPGR